MKKEIFNVEGIEIEIEKYDKFSPSSTDSSIFIT